MGDGDAGDAGDFGGPDFGPVTPAAHSAVGAPPTSPAVILGPGYHGRIVVTLNPKPGRPPAGDLDDQARTGPAGQLD